MQTRDYRDMIGGLLLICIGGFAIIYSLASLRIGSISRMGPGMIPMLLGIILASLGLAISLPAFFRSGEMPKIETRSLFAVIVAMLAFALLLRPFGIVPAVIALTVIASQADAKLSPLGLAITAICLTATAVLVFKVGLGIPLALVSWPW